MRRTKPRFVQSADGTRIVQLRQIRSARLEQAKGNGFLFFEIQARLRGGDIVPLATWTALEGSPAAENLPSLAQANMDRLCQLLNGCCLRKGEEWPKEEEV